MTTALPFAIEMNVPLPPADIDDIIDFVETSISVIEQCRHANNGWHRGYLAAMDDVLDQLV